MQAEFLSSVARFAENCTRSRSPRFAQIRVTRAQQPPQTSRPSNAASDGDGGSDSTPPLACGGGGSDTAQPPAESDGDGGSDIAQPLASRGSEGAVDFQQWRAAHGYRYYSSCSSSSSEGPEYEFPE